MFNSINAWMINNGHIAWLLLGFAIWLLIDEWLKKDKKAGK